MSKISLVLLTMISFIFTACSSKTDTTMFRHNLESTHVITSVSDEEYANDTIFEWKIAQGDRVQITVFNQSSSSTGQLSQILSAGGTQPGVGVRVGDEGMLIGTEGTVILPLVGIIKISGLTETEAADHLIQEYKKYLRNPYVSVKILNQKLFVLGEVKRPGVTLVTNGTMNLFEALAASGGMTDFARRSSVQIIRGSMRDPQVQVVDLTDFKSVKMASLILRPNDLVYVAPNDNKDYIYEMPFFQMISTVLSPFTQLITISVATKNL